LLRLSRSSHALPFLAAIAVSLFLLSIGSDVQAQALTASVTLTWTASGDDGLQGRASRYDLRYSAKVLANKDTMSWWNGAAAISMGSKTPSAAGTKDSVRINGLVIGLKYFAMIRVADEAGNWSSFSNLARIDLTGIRTGVESLELGTAPKLTVGAPYPSPTRGQAQVSLSLARSGPLHAEVYDARGRRVRSLHSGMMEAGPHVLRWDGNSEAGAKAAAGVYWIRVAADGVRETAKVVVVH
jgi:hypothetical protein